MNALTGMVVDQYLQTGAELLERRQAAQAAEVFRKLLLLAPEDERAWLGLGEAYLRLGQWDRAREMFEKLLRRRPGEPAVLLRLGMALRALRQAEAAVAALREAVERRPEWTAARVELGAALLVAGQLDDAVAAYTTALGLNPQSVRAWCGLAMAHERLGRIEQARATYRDALKVLAPQRRAAIFHPLGAFCLRRGLWQSARVALEKAARHEPQRARIASELCAVYARLGDWARAFKEAERLERLHPAKGARARTLLKQLKAGKRPGPTTADQSREAHRLLEASTSARADERTGDASDISSSGASAPLPRDPSPPVPVDSSAPVPSESLVSLFERAWTDGDDSAPTLADPFDAEPPGMLQRARAFCAGHVRHLLFWRR